MQTILLALVILVCFFQMNVAAFSQHVIERSNFRAMAMASARAGKNKEALMYLNKAIAKEPSDPQLYINRAAALVGEKQTTKALIDIQKAESLMKKGKSDPFAQSFFYSNRGSVYLSMGRDKDALADFKRSVDIFGDNDGARYELGKLYAKAGQKELALKNLTIARQLYIRHGFTGKTIELIDDQIRKLGGSIEKNASD